MTTRTGNIRAYAVFTAIVLIAAALITAPIKASAEDETAELITAYGDLWTGTISVKVGEPVRWYVEVPEDTEPKGCGATVKIPGLGFGTDTHNKEEGHIVLEKGRNFIYEFTPEETGDILFTCWMGSNCHSNYIHVTEDGSYDVPAPSDPSDIKAVWDGDNVQVSFTAPDAPEGSSVIKYKATATADDDTRKKASSTESPIVFEGLDSSHSYTISIVTIGTSGKSSGENTAVLEAAGNDEQSITEEQPAEETDEETQQIEPTAGDADNGEAITDTEPEEDDTAPTEKETSAEIEAEEDDDTDISFDSSVSDDEQEPEDDSETLSDSTEQTDSTTSNPKTGTDKAAVLGAVIVISAAAAAVRKKH